MSITASKMCNWEINEGGKKITGKTYREFKFAFVVKYFVGSRERTNPSLMPM